MSAMAKINDPSISLAALVPELAGHPAAATRLRGLQSDSRQLRPGEAFAAVAGAAGHGLSYLAEAVQRGATMVLVERKELERLDPGLSAVPLIPVAALGERLVELGGRCYGAPIASLSLCGITGTNGKTSCARLLAEAWQQLGTACAYVGTMGWGFGSALEALQHTTPDLLQLYRILAELAGQGARAVALEVSSHALAQQRCAGLEFSTALFTNLSRDHLDYHGSMREYAASKRRLFELPSLRQAVINGDDAFGRELLASLPDSLSLLDYGLEPGHSLGADKLAFSTAGCEARLRTPWGRATLRSRLLGRFNVSNLLGVLGVLGMHGVPLDDALAALAELAPIPGRMELLSRPKAPTVVVDYAHTPDALEQALTALRAHCDGSLWLVFGAGGERDRGKRPLMGEVAARLADRCVVTSDNPRREAPQQIIDDILSGMQGVSTEVEVDRARAIAGAIEAAAVTDWVLIAGKGHENYQDIGGQRRSFSDQAHARAALERRGERQ